MGRRILITGGTGSLGRALLARLYGVDDITIFSRDEVKQGELRHAYDGVRFMLGDVRDYDRLLLAMRGQECVLHAGAYKQVPSAETNVDEAIATNVLGSLNVARAAVHANVGFVVGVSTDKACMPINAYGATKSLMEKLFQQANDWGDTEFNCVRYGNVLCSRGSVVPLFVSQIDQGKTITITDPEMTRFWMTLDQAVDLVLAAIDPENAEIEQGAILVPPCPASTMRTLVEAVYRWQTGDTLPDDAYRVIGSRPGEKQHECLIHENESEHTLSPERLPYFQVLPSDHEYRGDRFAYTSEGATRLTVDELVLMLGLSGE